MYFPIILVYLFEREYALALYAIWKSEDNLGFSPLPPCSHSPKAELLAEPLLDGKIFVHVMSYQLIFNLETRKEQSFLLEYTRISSLCICDSSHS